MTDDGEDIPLSVAAGAEDAGQRLDAFLAARCEGLSRSRIKALMLEGRISVDGIACSDPSRKVKGGEEVLVEIPPPEDATPAPENIPLDIVFEDESLLVLNKAAGMVVHPAPGHARGTLVNALLHHCGDSLSGIGGVRRPGIVHRLDRDTSGLMVVAKTDRAHQALSAQLSDRTLLRRYRALVWGAMERPKGTVDQPVGRHPVNRQMMAVNKKNGRAAVTHYEVVEKFGAAVSLLDCRLETGRTHQIRVHMAHIGHCLVGDPVYGAQPTLMRFLLRKSGYCPEITEKIIMFHRQALHAWKLSFIHPVSGTKMEFDAEIPEDMANLVKALKNNVIAQ